jgi:hypothetical protein
MRRPLLVAAAASLALSVLAAPGAGAAPATENGGPVFTGETTKSVLPSRVHAQASKQAGGNPISYHKGKVMTAAGGVKAYYIYYGDWSGGGQPILNDFASNLGGSPYWRTNTGYYDAAKKYVSSNVTFGGAVTAQTNLGNALSDGDILTIVSNEITSNRVTKDVDGVYFLLTGKGVTATSGFLTQYCGWHTYANIGGTSIKYSFVGNADGPSLGSCAAQTAASPNGNPGVDAMVSVLAHELEEAATDPELNAWFDGRGYENADKCAWTFGTTYKAANGSIANMKLGGRDYLVQRNWKISPSQTCALA